MIENFDSIHNIDAKEFFLEASLNAIHKYKEFISEEGNLLNENECANEALNFLQDVIDNSIKRYLHSISDEKVFDNNSDKALQEQASLFFKEFADNTLNRYCNTFSNDTIIFEGKCLNKEEREKLISAQEECCVLFDTIVPRVVSKYNEYVSKVEPYIVRIQKYCRGKIVRLIYKMELMNMRLILENKLLSEKMKKRRLTKIKK
jgi:hypothetical protein